MREIILTEFTERVIGEDGSENLQFRFERKSGDRSSHTMVSMYLLAMLTFRYLLKELTQEDSEEKTIAHLKNEILDSIKCCRWLHAAI